VRTGSDTGVGLGLLALLPIACCAGLPLIVAAGLSLAAVATIGGITLAAIALVATLALVTVRARTRQRKAQVATPLRKQAR